MNDTQFIVCFKCKFKTIKDGDVYSKGWIYSFPNSEKNRCPDCQVKENEKTNESVQMIACFTCKNETHSDGGADSRGWKFHFYYHELNRCPECQVKEKENDASQALINTSARETLLLGKATPGTKLTLKEHVTLAALAYVRSESCIDVDKKFFQELNQKLINAKEIIIK